MSTSSWCKWIYQYQYMQWVINDCSTRLHCVRKKTHFYFDFSQPMINCVYVYLFRLWWLRARVCNDRQLIHANVSRLFYFFFFRLFCCCIVLFLFQIWIKNRNGFFFFVSWIFELSFVFQPCPTRTRVVCKRLNYIILNFTKEIRRIEMKLRNTPTNERTNEITKKKKKKKKKHYK